MGASPCHHLERITSSHTALRYVGLVACAHLFCPGLAMSHLWGPVYPPKQGVQCSEVCALCKVMDAFSPGYGCHQSSSRLPEEYPYVAPPCITLPNRASHLHIPTGRSSRVDDEPVGSRRDKVSWSCVSLPYGRSPCIFVSHRELNVTKG